MGLFSWFKKKEKQSFTISGEAIPPKVKRTADIYPILYHIPGNVAAGEIKKFNFIDSCRNRTDIGKQILSQEYDPNREWDCIWIHVGEDFFKLICKS